MNPQSGQWSSAELGSAAETPVDTVERGTDSGATGVAFEPLRPVEVSLAIEDAARRRLTEATTTSINSGTTRSGRQGQERGERVQLRGFHSTKSEVTVERQWVGFISLCFQTNLQPEVKESHLFRQTGLLLGGRYIA